MPKKPRKKKVKNPEVIEAANQHDFNPYFESMTAELNSIRNRVRQLVRHWPTDGHFKESILRQVLRRHLPETVSVGTGFVVNSFGSSGEIDILITDRSMPTLFRDGELTIVTPESVRAIVEVKTSLNSMEKIREAMLELAARKAVATRHVQNQDVWAGLFVYDGRRRDWDRALLELLLETRNNLHTVIDCVAYGNNAIVKYFRPLAGPCGQHPENAWLSAYAPKVAASSFIASVIEHVVPALADLGAFAWYRPPSGFQKRFIVQNDRNAQVSCYNEWLREHRSP